MRIAARGPVSFFGKSIGKGRFQRDLNPDFLCRHVSYHLT